MNWTTIKQWWAVTSGQQRAPQRELALAGVTTCGETLLHTQAHPQSEGQGHSLSSSATGRTSQSTRMWRRRAILRKGARLYSTLSATTDVVSLAMLDEDGIVVAWYERARDLDLDDSVVVDRHISHLYVPEDVALGVPVRDLCSATIHGSDTQKGWRRGSDGATFWATTVIRPLLFRDGRLQGFSHETRRTPAPWRDDRGASSWFSKPRKAAGSRAQ